MGEGKEKRKTVRQTIGDSQLGEQTGLLKAEVFGGQGNWVMGIKKGTQGNEDWVLYATDESLNSSSETKNTVYVK